MDGSGSTDGVEYRAWSRVGCVVVDFVDWRSIKSVCLVLSTLDFTSEVGIARMGNFRGAKVLFFDQ